MLTGGLQILTAVFHCCSQNFSDEVDQQPSQPTTARIVYPVDNDRKVNRCCCPRFNVVVGSIRSADIEQGEAEHFTVSA